MKEFLDWAQWVGGTTIVGAALVALGRELSQWVGV